MCQHSLKAHILCSISSSHVLEIWHILDLRCVDFAFLTVVVSTTVNFYRNLQESGCKPDYKFLLFFFECKLREGIVKYWASSLGFPVIL